MLRRLIPVLAAACSLSISQMPIPSVARAQEVIRNGVRYARYPRPYNAPQWHVSPSRVAPLSGTTVTSDINFDDAGAPCLFIETTALRNAYQAVGVVFSGPGALNGGAILNQCGGFGVSGYSPPNFVAFNSFAMMSDGGIPNGPQRMSFSSDVSSVRVGVASYGGTATLTAYSASLQWLASVSLPVGSTLQFLQVNAPGIRYVDLSVPDSPSGVWVFDDLSFEAAPPCPATPMTFDLDPNTLNLKSMGHWVTARLEPEPPASPAAIDVASILLNGTVPVDASAPTSIGDADEDGRPDLTVKFDREAVGLTVQEGEAVTVTATGEIGDGCFEATDVIRVRRGRVIAPTAATVLLAWSQTEVRWDTMDDLPVQWAALLSSSDHGESWTLEASHLPNTGTHLWTVRNGATRVAVVLVESADESGTEVTGVLAMTDVLVASSPLAVGDSRTELVLYGAQPNPGRGLKVSFSLHGAEPASLAVYDVTGREVTRREVGGLGAGPHVVTLEAPGALSAGVYLVYLIQGDRRVVARAVVVD